MDEHLEETVTRVSNPDPPIEGSLVNIHANVRVVEIDQVRPVSHLVNRPNNIPVVDEHLEETVTRVSNQDPPIEGSLVNIHANVMVVEVRIPIIVRFLIIVL